MPNSESSLLFDYPVRVQPHLTDYAGVVWHGSYLRWLEEARIDALRQVGVEYVTLVSLGCDLPVINLNLTYCSSLKMGDRAVVKSFIQKRQKVRLIWSQTIYALVPDGVSLGSLALKAEVTLVPFDMKKRRILRILPPELELKFEQLTIQ